MKLTRDELIAAIQSARSLEKLQADLRTAMVEHIFEQSPSDIPANTALPGVPTS